MQRLNDLQAKFKVLHFELVDVIEDEKALEKMIICATRAECRINDQCLVRVSGVMCEYEADDSDNHENGLRAADHQRIQHHGERLPDNLQLKVGARVIL